MAYINQDKKKVIQAKLKTIIPKGWKWSLRIDNHSTLILTIQSSPIDFLKNIERQYVSLNTYWLADSNILQSVGMVELFKSIRDAMNTNNYDKSDIASDYHEVGHYIDISIGRWDKPYTVSK